MHASDLFFVEEFDGINKKRANIEVFYFYPLKKNVIISVIGRYSTFQGRGVARLIKMGHTRA